MAKAKATRSTSGVRRRVIHQGWCSKHHAGLVDWEGPQREYQSEAAFDLAGHNMDAHGGTPRGDEDTPRKASS